MNRSPFILLALVPVIAFLPACTDANEGENGVNWAEQDLTLELAVPDVVGTYYSDAVMVGRLHQLVLKMDHKFHAGITVVCHTITAPCLPMQIDGTFRLVAFGEHKYMTLYEGSKLWGAYEYAKRGDNLVLYPVKVAEGSEIISIPSQPAWQLMTRAEIAWCAAPTDCPLQNLTSNSRCQGDWTCGTNWCNYVCAASPNQPPGTQNMPEPEGLLPQTRDPDPR